MPLSPLNPLLEILTAFNFAFVASSTFLNDLNLKLTGSFAAVREEMKSVKTQIIESESYINTGIEKNNGLMALLDRKEDLNRIIKLKNDYKAEIRKDIEKLSASSVFQRFSLFGGIYCLLILFLATYDEELKDYNLSMMLIIFNVVSLIFLIWMNWPKKLKVRYPWKPGTWDVMLTFVVGSFFSFADFLIFEVWYKLHCPKDLNFILKISILLVPSAHFLYYFLRALLRSKQLGKKKLDDCKDLSKQLSDLAIRTQGNLDVLQQG
ncbi:MAG: hypothetical protein ABI761_06780 [Saprospiraceae bacterium]